MEGQPRHVQQTAVIGVRRPPHGETTVNPPRQVGNAPELRIQSLLRGRTGQGLQHLLLLLPGEQAGVPVPGVPGANGIQAAPPPFPDPPADRPDGAPDEIRHEPPARPPRQHENGLGHPPHQLVRGILPMSPESIPLLIGQHNNRHGEIVHRPAIPDPHPETPGRTPLRQPHPKSRGRHLVDYWPQQERTRPEQESNRARAGGPRRTGMGRRTGTRRDAGRHARPLIEYVFLHPAG